MEPSQLFLVLSKPNLPFLLLKKELSEYSTPQSQGLLPERLRS